MNSRQNKHEDVEDMLDDCLKRRHKLEEWEDLFIESITDQFISNGSLSDKQYAQLVKIWEKVT